MSKEMQKINTIYQFGMHSGFFIVQYSSPVLPLAHRIQGSEGWE